jgi:uncharacterized protein (TIGR04141 family)
MPDDPRTRPLSIYLFKSNLARPVDAVKASTSIQHIAIGHGRGSIGILYYRTSPSRSPRWVEFFETHIDPHDLLCSNVAAVFITRAAGRLFALTFGAGRHLLQPGTFQEDFGLRTTLNSVSPERIRTIDRKTLDATGRHSKEQASRNIPIIEFGLDIDKDILRAVTGPPEDSSLGSRLAGADALSAVVQADITNINHLLEEYFTQYRKRRYREHFPWVDNIREVTDYSLREQLDSELSGRIRSRDLERIWMAVPDLVDWHDVAGFTFSKASEADNLMDDIGFEQYLSFVRRPETIEKKDLLRHRVFCISAETETPKAEWSVYKCIYAEIDRNRRTYLLNGGRWYEVAIDYVSEVNDAVHRIPPSSNLALPEFDDRNEEAYVQRVCAMNSERFALMDRRLIPYGGGHSRIEFCDIYSQDKKIVHVKRYGGSGTLSHLFAQGSVSALLFLNDPRFRAAVNNALPSGHRLRTPAEPLNSRDYEIAYVISSKSEGALVLPFFSRVTLRTVATQLRNMGYGITLTKVQCT